ncbi:MAG: TolC family protein [Bacteroidales bacterium]|nr:TolC family protein [Bacteroidales bacterium]
MPYYFLIIDMARLMKIIKPKFCLLLLFITGLTLISTAQKTWSLEDCISYAMENNIQVKQQELTGLINQNNLIQSKWNLLPNLNASAAQNYSFGRYIDPYTNDFSAENTSSSQFGLNSSLILFEGFSKTNTIKKNELILKSSLYDLDKIKNDISLSIATAYLQILFNIELLETTKAQAEITRQEAERMELLVNSDLQPQGKLLEVLAQVSNEQLQIVNMQNQLNMAYLNLVQLMELDSANNFEIVKPEINPINFEFQIPETNELFNQALQSMPQILSAECNLKSAEYDIAIAKGRRLPRLSLNANYGSGYSSARQKYSDPTYSLSSIPGGITESNQNVYFYNYSYNTVNYPFMEQFKDNAATTVSFSLTIPLFNGWQTNLGVRNAQINSLNYQNLLAQQKNQLFKEIQQAQADAIAAIQRYKAAEKSVEAFEKSFNYSKERFDAGLINTIEYNTAKNQLTNAQSEMLQAKYDFVFKMKILDYYRGNPIKL